MSEMAALHGLDRSDLMEYLTKFWERMTDEREREVSCVVDSMPSTANQWISMILHSALYTVHPTPK